jgi:hypothetical protein
MTSLPGASDPEREAVYRFGDFVDSSDLGGVATVRMNNRPRLELARGDAFGI